MKKSVKIIVKSLIGVLFSLSFSVFAVFAWFTDIIATKTPSYSGSTDVAYFAGGDGSADKPYLISSPIHFYNFAWLQYLGYFNMNSSFNNGNAQNYFKLTENIDMSRINSAIPPVGTEQYPFIGFFDGNNNTITHVTVSNDKADLTMRPNKAEFNNTSLLYTTDKSQEISVVGLFGVTGNYNGYTAKYDHSGFDAKKMSVGRFYTDYVHVKSSSEKTLVGLLAGYVGASFQQTGVYNGYISLADSAKGVKELTEDESIVSKYSIIGAYDKNAVKWSSEPSGGGDGGDGDEGWGGSIDFRTLARRLNYMFAELNTNGSVGTTGSYNIGDTTNTFHLNARVQVATFESTVAQYQYNYNTVAGTYSSASLKDGTYLPLNVDMGLFDDKGNETANSTKTIGSLTWNTGGKYGTQNDETIPSSNPGFIVGGGGGDTSMGAVRVRITNFTRGDIKNSFGGSTTAYDDSALRLLAYDKGDNSFKFISDDINNLSTNQTITVNKNSYGVKTVKDFGFVTYNARRSSFGNFLGKNGLVYGMGIYSSIDCDNRLEIIQGEKKKYELVKNAINFHVEKPGVVTMIVGGYTTYNFNERMPVLYKVERDNADGSIKSYVKISQVYQHIDENGKTSYTVNPSSTSAGDTLVYSSDWYNSNLSGNTAYYVEIPVPEGDYVVGKDSTTSSGHIMYLDIGANGNDDGGGGGGEGTTYTMQSVDFVNTATVPTRTDETTGKEESYYPAYKTVAVSVGGVQSGTPYLLYQRASGTETGVIATDTKLLYKFENINFQNVVPTPSELAEFSNALVQFINYKKEE